jgi:hypothetical protein
MARTSSTLWLGVLLLASLGGCMTWRPPPAPDLDRPAAPGGQARLEAAQDPVRLQGPRAWNVYFQQDARRMLADMNRILPLPTRSPTSMP